MTWWRVLAGSVLAAAVMATPAPTSAATFEDSGWWYRLDGAPPPPGVPDDGLYVQGTPEGATAVAAVTYTLSAEETDPVLELTEVPLGEDESPPPTTLPGDVPAPPPETEPAAEPVLLACRAGSSWTSAQAGAWDDRPEATCDARAVRGERSAEGATWTFSLGPLQVGTTIDVVLVPGTVDDLLDGADGSTFEIAFARPGDNAMATTKSVGGFTGGPPGGAESPASRPASPPAAVPPEVGFVPSPPVTVKTTPVDRDLGAGGEPKLPQPEPTQDLAQSAPSIGTDSPVPGPSENDDDRARWFAAVVLVLGAGLVLWASRQTPRPVQSLSRFVRARPPGV